MKTNQKSVRLTDQEINCIEGYRGSNFNESLSNMIYDMCQKHDSLVAQWNMTQEEINRRRDELRCIIEKVRRARVVDARLQPLLEAVIALME